ncbi:MAG: zinc ribbon domain-containing protein [Chloroflexota bacterium]|nr:zinc ribbon domain-containing protein [Chloroflexota bacterium]
MTDETVDCFNCGRANPEWAQVCRSCGVALRHGEARVVPAGRFPTDRNSLISLAAVLGTIVAAMLFGLFVAGLNPTDPPVAAEPSATATATATATPTEEPSVAPTESVAASVSVAPSASEAPALPATIVFGSELDGDRQIVEPVDTFTPGMAFAHSVTSTEPFGVETIGEQIVRLNEDGSEGDQLVAADGNQLPVNPEATSAGFVAGDSANFVRDWGPGAYEMRVYAGETLIARGSFRLAEG